jgi:hypothetical protein
MFCLEIWIKKYMLSFEKLKNDNNKKVIFYFFYFTLNYIYVCKKNCNNKCRHLNDHLVLFYYNNILNETVFVVVFEVQ